MDKIPVSLAFNCGYARVAAIEYSCVGRGKTRSSINRETRIEKFQNLFRDYENFARPQTEFWFLSHLINQSPHLTDIVTRC